MKALLLSAFLSFTLLNSLLAQTQQTHGIVKGSVVDSANNQPLSFVTVLLKDTKTNQAEKSTLTKDDGSFQISAPAGKSYQLVFAFIGYKSKTIAVPAFTTADKFLANVKQVLLSPTTGQLKEVSIVEAKPLMKQEVDRITYDVQADPESKATNALDMIRKVPLLSVDANDNIKMKGSGNYKILINGKESALMAKNPSDVLKAMPATNIEKVEVITTPPAKYDAEGLAGIINIITKKNADQGYNGNINARYNSVYGPGVNLNATFKKGKFGLSGYVGYGSDGSQTTESGSTQTFFASQSVISQNSVNSYHGHEKYGNLELSFEADTLNLFSASVEFYKGRQSTDRDQLSAQVDNLNTPMQKYHLLNNSYENYSGFDASLSYQLGFKNKKDQLLTLIYKHSYSPFTDYNDNSFSDTLNFGQHNYRQYNTAGTRNQTLQLDYAQPTGKRLTIEAGAKAALRNSFSDFETSIYNNLSNQYNIDNNQTNNFNYNQKVYSIYNSYQLKLAKWTGKAGLRMEHTTIDADFISSAQTVSQGYTNLIPSISLQRSFKSSSFNLGYTERIQRPRTWQINPFVDKTNPKFITTGNPDLRPELSHSFEFTYSNFAKASFNVGLSYAFSNNSIQSVSYFTTVNNAANQPDVITTTTFQNLGSNKSLGINLNTNLTITKKLSLSVNGHIQQLWIKGTYNGQFYKNDGIVGNAFMNAGYKFDNGYRIGFNAGYYSGDVNLQGQNSFYIYNSYVFSKEFLDKKASISLVANNPYSKFNTYNSTTNTPDFAQTMFNQHRYRNFSVRLSYKFGKLNGEIKKKKATANIDDSSSGGKGSK